MGILLAHTSPLTAPAATLTRRGFPRPGRFPNGRCSGPPSSSVSSPPGRIPSLNMTDLFSVRVNELPSTEESLRLRTPTGTMTLGTWEDPEAETCSDTGTLKPNLQQNAIKTRTVKHC